MKPFSASLNKLALLVTTMMFAPSLAMAQETPPAAGTTEAAPVESQAAPAAEDDTTTVSEDGDVETVVLGRFIPEPMRETSEVATFLSSADLARQGDDNAAAALTRLSGLSVVSGRFVYVRGLGDRYSSALLNGSPLPSPEPLRRQVPLDLFPSNILDGATVQKTFSPNYPGEFGGGIIDLRTLKLPNEPFFTVKLGTGGSTESTDKRGLTYFGEEDDWTGISYGRREIPGPLEQAIGTGRRITNANFTTGQLETIGESLVNSPFTVIQSEAFDPDVEGEVTAGTSIDYGKYNIGLIGVVGYDKSWRSQIAERVAVAGDAIQTDKVSTKGVLDVVLNAFASASVGWDANQIALTGLLVRSSSKEAQIVQGTSVDLDPLGRTQEQTQSTAWYERQLASAQLSGEHEFGPFTIDWRTAFAQSTRDAPYERDITYSLTDGVALYSRDGQNRTRFSYLTDEVASLGIDGTYTIALSEQRDLIISGGYDYSNTVREYELYTFSFRGPNTRAGADVLGARVDFLFSPDNITPLRFELAEFTGRDDSYKGRLTVDAAYLSADAEILPLVRAAVGFRYEDGRQLVRTGNRFGETPFASPVNIEEAYFLPAGTLTWNFAEDLQLRLGYSQTIARPQFRELAFTPYIDPETDRTYQGNTRLENSEFQNYDARVEYYFGRDQFVTLAGFYKQIEKPIEEVIVAGQGGTITNFINAPEATLYGAEAEFRTRIASPLPLPFLPDAELLFGVNYTYTKSEVEAGAGTTVIDPTDPLNPTPRPATVFGLDGTQLQGTPEHIANLLFGIENVNTQLTLLVGWVDTRIARRGLGSLPAVLEDPGVNVDLVLRRDFSLAGTDFTLGLAGRNLLDEDHEEYQQSRLGRTEANTYARGVNYSISLTSKF